MDSADLNNRFTFHPAKPEQASRYESFRDKAKALAFWVDSYAPDSREKSLSITALEECVFWANAAIARNT